MMKLCKDCKYCKPFIWNGDVLFHHCTLRSHKYIIDPVYGIYAYKEYSTVRCSDEREDSTGFFGFFIDKDRCGVDAKNFEPKEIK